MERSKPKSSNLVRGEPGLADLENEILENDLLRRTFKGGCIEISDIVAVSSMATSILYGIRNYDRFSEHGSQQDDHGFGVLRTDEGWIFWEILRCEKFAVDACGCTLSKVLKIYYDFELEI